MGDLVATHGRPYRKAGSRVLAPLCRRCRLPSCLSGAVAGAGSPPRAQHGAVAAPCAQRWPQAVGVIPGPRPLCAPLTPEEDCGLGLPARFFLEMEGVFISSRFFLENMVEPVLAAPGVDSSPGGVSARQLPVLVVSGPHCSGPPPPQLSAPRDGPGPHWRASPQHRKRPPAEGGREGERRRHRPAPGVTVLMGLCTPALTQVPHSGPFPLVVLFLGM